MMYILSPWINKLLENIELKSLFKLCLILTFTWSICPSISNIFMFNINFLSGYDISYYIYIYLLGALIRRIEDKIPQTPKKYLLLGVLMIVIIAISEVIIGYAGVYINKQFAGNEETLRNEYSILIILATIFLFLGFKQTNIKNNKVINMIASTTLGVYILHDNPVLKKFIWYDLFNVKSFQYSKMLIPHAIIVSLIIFFVCVLIDILRQEIIEKPIMKKLRDPIEKLEKGFDDKIDKLVNKFE